MEKETEMRVKILFKSGNSIEMWFKSFDIEYGSNGIENVKWELDTSRNQAPVWFDMKQIEGIFIMDQIEE